eukprot:7220078-Prymnesium_polylepis.1
MWRLGLSAFGLSEAKGDATKRIEACLRARAHATSEGDCNIHAPRCHAPPRHAPRAAFAPGVHARHTGGTWGPRPAHGRHMGATPATRARPTP